jgi:hypothetical protein
VQDRRSLTGEDMMRLLIAAALMLFALPAQAQTRDWQFVGGNKEIRTYIDSASVERSGDTATVSVLSIFDAPIGTVYGFEMIKIYDCKAMRYREGDGTAYSATGRVLGRDPGKEPDTYYPTRANSVEESARLYACFGQNGRGRIADPFADSAEVFDWEL